jgi:hypothetical protein
VFVQSTQELTKTLETLIEARATQRAEAVIGMATDFMSEHIPIIQAALDEKQPIRVADLIGRATGTLRQIAKVAVAPGSVRAVPRGVRSEGMGAAPLVFWFDAIVVAVVADVVSMALPVQQEPVRAGLELTGIGLGPLSFDFSVSDVEKEITVPMEGTAVARFDGTRYVGPPTIESLGVSRTTTLSQALGADRS